MENNETVCACALGKVFGYEPRIALQMVESLGSASAVFALSQKERDSLLGPYSKYSGMLTDALLDAVAEELVDLRTQGCRFLPLSDPAFPKLLRECEDPPAGLYYRSASPPEEIFADRPAIAVVGTRDMSPYGREWCGKIVSSLSGAVEKPLIVSGLAFGVDITAHIAALGNGLPTIAVLPVGIESVYPRTHTGVAKRIVEAPGSALITDYPPGTGPTPFTFLRRNRLIAALTKATILIESRKHGGGLITARLAAGYGRDVFALPGRIDDLRSEGCNILLKEKTAEPIVSLSAIGGQLGLGRIPGKQEAPYMERVREALGNLPESRRKGLERTAEAIRKHRGISIDELCALLSLPYKEVSPQVLTLESEGLVQTDLQGRCTAILKFA